MRQLFFLAALVPSLAFAQKPDCETIRKQVEETRSTEIGKLESELMELEKLRNDLRRGRGTLKGSDARKPRREQLQIVMDRIKAVQEKIEETRTAILLPRFTIRDLKTGHFGYFGKADDDFRIVEVIDKETFTAFIRYQTTSYVGGVPAVETKTTVNLYLIKGIKTQGYVDNKLAGWKGYLYCSGTQKLRLNAGNETVFVLEPLDVESCFETQKKGD